jgi:hypothetical protein
VNSFISSFKPVLVAIAIIGLIEGIIALVVKPDVVEQSNYLNWMYGEPDPFHKFLIYSKMREIPSSKADVIQVGDSSGFHGIRSNLVMKEVDGVRYFNLSCCANTGYDGYYDFVKFALEHDPELRAVVLYITFNNLPQLRLIGGDAKLGAAKIHEAYVGPWSIVALPSIALRSVVTDMFYSLFGYVVPRRNGLTDNLDAVKMMQSVQTERGWWGEHDPRNVGDKGKQFFSQLCGDPLDLWNVGRDSLNSTNGEFLPLVTFDKFASLAKSYDKKLIVVFHPHPCSRLNENTLQALKDAVSQVKQKYSNLYVYPEGIFEHWPREVFTGADHLYLGYEHFSSRRLGRFVAAALGLPAKTTGDIAIPLPLSSLLHADEKPVWQNESIDNKWQLQGVTATPESGSSWRILETTAQAGLHSLETRISGLVPDRYYLVTLSFEPIGEDRLFNLSLRDAVGGQGGVTWCDPAGREAGRRADFYDGSMVVNADGSMVCWGIIKLTQDQAYLGIVLQTRQNQSWYPGDGRSGMLLRSVRLYMRSSPDVVLNTGELD